jgi:DNA invertase Pin-like site-specific DNA recombinase
MRKLKWEADSHGLQRRSNCVHIGGQHILAIFECINYPRRDVRGARKFLSGPFEKLARLPALVSRHFSSKVWKAGSSLVDGAKQHQRFVAYYRVSTGRQGESGLGIDAQRAAVCDYVAANEGRLIAEFSEIVSGRKNDRPQLAMALTTCRIMGAVLVIARLDRLARNVAMIARLMESGLDFVATDFPHANKFTIHVLAAVAEYESRIQSERMKAVLAALKQRGIKVGNTKRDSTRRFPPGCQQASAQARQARAEARRRDLAPLVWKSIAEGKSHRLIADEFNETGVSLTRHSKWTKHAIWRIAVDVRLLVHPNYGRARAVILSLLGGC